MSERLCSFVSAVREACFPGPSSTISRLLGRLSSFHSLYGPFLRFLCHSVGVGCPIFLRSKKSGVSQLGMIDPYIVHTTARAVASLILAGFGVLP